MKKVALYGGSFDPPHMGHVVTVKNLLNSGEVDEVWLVPTGDDRYDKLPTANATHRQKMVELVIENSLKNLAVRLETIQLEEVLKVGSQTINLIEWLAEKYPDHKFTFVVGADKIDELPSWVEFERLKKMISFFVVPRPGEEVPDEIPEYIKIIQFPEMLESEASSTKIRESLSLGDLVDDLIPLEINDYLKVNKIY